ncbi:hypothetical protein PBY51_016717 [Eleginops maclovinus]|uniref:Uncharacterized protein n=1 Tax=Eleginops maclovinus TaxID=56733 RepID=A0AAN8AAA4_ELEMC|nr:hypothetical protein PBY51_016717 [Eleginops maclovinus]
MIPTGHFGSPSVMVQPTSAAKPCTELRTRPMSTTSLHPKKISNTRSPSCSDKLAFLWTHITLVKRCQTLDSVMYYVTGH